MGPPLPLRAICAVFLAAAGSTVPSCTLADSTCSLKDVTCDPVIALARPGSASLLSGTAAGGPCNPCRIFVTGATTGALGGITGADAFCMSSTPPNTSTYKAMIVDAAGTRAACTPGNGNCSNPAFNVNWVMHPNTAYVKADGITPVMTTNAAGIFLFGTFTNAISCPGCSAWTGFNFDWTTNGNTCSNWTNGTAGAVGPWGNSGATGSAVLYDGTPTPFCNTGGIGVYCVEQ